MYRHNLSSTGSVPGLASRRSFRPFGFHLFLLLVLLSATGRASAQLDQMESLQKSKQVAQLEDKVRLAFMTNSPDELKRSMDELGRLAPNNGILRLYTQMIARKSAAAKPSAFKGLRSRTATTGTVPLLPADNDYVAKISTEPPAEVATTSPVAVKTARPRMTPNRLKRIDLSERAPIKAVPVRQVAAPAPVSAESAKPVTAPRPTLVPQQTPVAPKPVAAPRSVIASEEPSSPTQSTSIASATSAEAPQPGVAPAQERSAKRRAVAPKPAVEPAPESAAARETISDRARKLFQGERKGFYQAVGAATVAFVVLLITVGLIAFSRRTPHRTITPEEANPPTHPDVNFRDIRVNMGEEAPPKQEIEEPEFDDDPSAGDPTAKPSVTPEPEATFEEMVFDEPGREKPPAPALPATSEPPRQEKHDAPIDIADIALDAPLNRKIPPIAESEPVVFDVDGSRAEEIEFVLDEQGPADSVSIVADDMDAPISLAEIEHDEDTLFHNAEQTSLHGERTSTDIMDLMESQDTIFGNQDSTRTTSFTPQDLKEPYNEIDVMDSLVAEASDDETLVLRGASEEMSPEPETEDAGNGSPTPSKPLTEAQRQKIFDEQYEKGCDAFQRQDYREAQQHFSVASSLKPDDLEVANRLAMVRKALKKR